MSDERATRDLLVDLLVQFHGRGWVSGTGGGICGPADDGGLLLAPTGVHKELIKPDEFFTVDPARWPRRPHAGTRRPPPERVQRDLLPDPSRARRAGASSTPMGCPPCWPPTWRRCWRRPHRHPRPRDAQGHPGRDQHATSTSCRSSATRHASAELVDQLETVFADPRFAPAHAVLVARPRRVHLGRRRHGCQATHRGLPLPVRSHGRPTRPPPEARR